MVNSITNYFFKPGGPKTAPNPSSLPVNGPILENGYPENGLETGFPEKGRQPTNGSVKQSGFPENGLFSHPEQGLNPDEFPANGCQNSSPRNLPLPENER